MWSLVALAGCIGSTGSRSAGPSSIQFEPIAIYFGDVPWDVIAWAELTLSNVGEEQESFELVPTSEAFVLGHRGELVLGPSAAVSVPVEWLVDSLETLDASIEVRVDGTTTAIIPVVGERTFPWLRTSRGRYVVDDVTVGCSGDVFGRLENRGSGAVRVSTMELVNEGEFTLTDRRTGEPIVVPFSIAAGSATVPFRVSFAPTAEHESTTQIRIESNDPETRVLEVDVIGRGVWHAADTISLSWIVAPRTDALTALFEINSQVVDYGDRVLDAFEAFLTAFEGKGISFRMGIVAPSDGSWVWPRYIDDTFTMSDARSSLTALLSATSGDEDASLERLLWGIDQNRDWLFDAGDPKWSASSLHLVAINIDAEQSPRDAKYYVEQYRLEKDDPALILVHGIAGPPPIGCSGGSGATDAVPSVNLFTAAELTGGAFWSICDDWTTNFERLAFAMQRTLFGLEGLPDVSTIAVSIDGVEITSGWWYDADLNAIVFDDATYPAVGSRVDVEYVAMPVCE